MVLGWFLICFGAFEAVLVGKAWRRALRWLYEIKEDGLEQGLLSYKAALKVLEKEGRWQEATDMP